MRTRRKTRVARLFPAYAQLIRAELGLVLVYRIRLILSVLTFVFPLVMMAAWMAVVDEEGEAAAWGSADVVSYYLVATVVYQLTSAWVVSRWDDEIRTGALSTKLLKPLNPVHHLLAAQLSSKVFLLVFMVPVMTAAVLITRVQLRPPSFAMAMAAAGSLLVGFVLNLSMNLAFAMLSFWTTRATTLFVAWSGLGQLFSGFVAPLPLLPGGLRRVASLLPFWGTLGLPVEIFSAKLGWEEIGAGMITSMAWTAVFLTICRALWRTGLRRYEGVGG